MDLAELTRAFGAFTARMKKLSSLTFYPITFPIVVGLGTIATIIIYAGIAKTIEGTVAIGAVLGVVHAILFAALFFASAFG